MKHFSVVFENTTPLFLGGVDHRIPAEPQSALRVSAIKAELLFWWRAVAFDRIATEFEPADDYANALERLHEYECALFGAPSKEKSGGHGAIVISARWSRHAGPKVIRLPERFSDKNCPENPILRMDGTDEKNSDVVSSGLRYLGYGLMHGFYKKGSHSEGTLLRECISPGAWFKVEISIRQGKYRRFGELDDADPRSLATLETAIEAMGLLGGLGARKRRGWGSLGFVAAGGNSFNPPQSTDEYRTRLQKILSGGKSSGIAYPLSAVARETDIYLGDTGETKPLEALEKIGASYKLYRSWGYSGNGGAPKVDGQQSLKNFKPDHDWFKSGESFWASRAGNGKACEALPERAVFGLPLNFQSVGSPQLSVGADHRDSREKHLGRRASPLFFHVGRVDDGRGTVTYLPAAIFFDNLFLPRNTLRFVKSKGSNVDEVASKQTYSPDSSVIRDYLTGNSARIGATGVRQATFPGKTVKPT